MSEEKKEKRGFKYWFRQIKKFPSWIFFLPAKTLDLLSVIMRHEIIDPNGYLTEYNKPGARQVIGIVWHNRLLFFPSMCPRKARRRTVAVISASRDGQYIADLIAQFGIKSVRGSSSRNAVKVLYDAFKSLKGGSFIAMTPDGPRGPKYQMHKGAIQLASKMGVPIVPLAVNYSSYWELKSWDRFQIPKPWSKITLVVGDEITVPADLTPEAFEAYRLKVENALNAITVDKK